MTQTLLFGRVYHYLETDAHSQMHCGGLWKGAAGRGCVFLLNN